MRLRWFAVPLAAGAVAWSVSRSEPPTPVVPSTRGLVLPSPVALDLADVRAELPDNLYWTWGAPTDDRAVLAARAEARRERNHRYGAVLSGNASRSEIDAYYDERTRISEDALQVAERVLERRGDRLSERDVGLFELARALHRRRLAELPDERARAFDRMVRQDEARVHWNEGREPW